MEVALATIAARYRIRLILVFGSAVTGRVHPQSDVDLAILFDRSEPVPQDYADLIGDLQALFPDREVDLGVINHADPLFLKKITEHCEILYGPVAELQRLRIYAFKRYVDHAKYFAMERDFAAKFVATASGHP
jgi:predicted nucleotidyltransferase